MKYPDKRNVATNPIPSVRWAAYSAAAAASTFVAAPQAEATIHYSGPINERFTSRRTDSFPLDPAGGVLIFKHSNHVYGSSSFHDGGTARAFVEAPVSASMNGYELDCSHNPDVSASISNLDRRTVMSQRPFVPDGGVLGSHGATFYGCGENGRGQFLARERNAFVGFKFNNGAGVQYGWARLRVIGYPFNRFTLVDYAYGDPGERVVAGQRQSIGSAPSLESLAGLALSATAVIAWRRRRAKQAA
jgi:hypothetical protein